MQSEFSWLFLLGLPLALAACGDDGADASCFDAAPTSCAPALVGGDGAPITYTTSACWTVLIDQTTVTVTDPFATGRYEAWGSGNAASTDGTAHENLNGKHIKDWTGYRRTVLFGGTTLTMSAGAGTGIQSLSLYDGARGYRVDTTTNTVVSTTDEAGATQALEAAEADGETARVFNNPTCGITFDNVWQQDEDGDGAPLDRVEELVPLGATPGPENPNQTNDFYDDPDLGHT